MWSLGPAGDLPQPGGANAPPCGGQGLEGNWNVPASPFLAPLRCQSPIWLPVPVPLRGERRAGRSLGLPGRVGRPPVLSPLLCSAQTPGDPRLTRGRGSHAQGGHDSFEGLRGKCDRGWANGRGRGGPPVPPSLCTHRRQGPARGSTAGHAEVAPSRRGSLRLHFCLRYVYIYLFFFSLSRKPSERQRAAFREGGLQPLKNQTPNTR